MYPCRYLCSDPMIGRIAIHAQASSPEEIYVTNTSADPVDLEGYVVENPPYVYNFGPATVVEPGATARLVVVGSPSWDTALVKHWGKSKYFLNNTGDRVALRTQTNIVIDCYAWGSMAC